MSDTACFNRYLTHLEEKRLFSAVRQTSGYLAERDDAWMRLLRYTGIRVGALAQLTCAHARHALACDHLTLERAISKGGVAYTVFVSKRGKQALRDLLRIRRHMGMAEVGDGALIVSRKKSTMSIRNFQLRTASWGKKAGIVGTVTPHWFRHTVAKRIMQDSTAKNPFRMACAVLGHRSPASTLIYTKPDKEDMVNVMAEVC